MSNKINKTSIATGFVAFGAGAAFIALKSQVDNMKKDIVAMNKKVDEGPTWDVVDSVERVVKSQGRRIDYLEGLLERNGIEVAPPRNVQYIQTRHVKPDNAVTFSSGRQHHDDIEENSYEDDRRAPAPTLLRETNIPTRHTHPVNPPSTDINRPRDRQPVRGELIEKSEQELELEVTDDIY